MTAVNPYVGPRAFAEADRENFFGREREIGQLQALAVARRVVLLYSPSGAGKTSLLAAGLVPRLRKLPGATVWPVARVGSALPEAAGQERAGNVYTASVLLDLLGHEAGPDLAAGFAARLEQEPASTRPRTHFLILDQFEELFTTHADRYPQREGFLRELRAALDAHPQVTLILAMREDYIAHLDVFRALLPDHLRTRFRLDLLAEEAALAAMVKPAASAGVAFREEVARALVDDLRVLRVQTADGHTHEQLGQHVDPVQLQVVCRRLWDGLEPGVTEIGSSQLARVGDVDHALADYYAEQVAAAARATGVAERAVRDWLDRHLITAEGLRGQVLRQAESTQGLDNRAIAALVASHLVRAEERRGATFFELAHDRLIAPIQADNRQWRERHLSTLERRAALWAEEKRSKDMLLAGTELAQAEAWAAARPALPELEREYLAACQRVRRRRRRHQLGVALLALLTLIALVACAVAFHQRSLVDRARADAEAALRVGGKALYTAREQRLEAKAARKTAEGERQEAYHQRGLAVAARDRAERQARLILANSLTMAAHNHLEGKLDLALLLSLEAMAVEDSFDTRNALVAALQQEPQLDALLGRVEGGADALAWSPDGQHLAVVHGDRLQRWDVATARPVTETLPGHEGHRLTAAAWSPAGDRLALADERGHVVLWTVGGDAGVAELSLGHRREVTRLAWSADGRYLASGDGEGALKVWDVAAREQLPASWQGNGIAMVQLAWSPDGSRLATVERGAQTLRVRTLTGGETSILAGGRDAVTALTWSADSRQLIAGHADGAVLIWAADHEEPRVRQPAGTGRVVALAPGGVDSLHQPEDGTLVLSSGKPLSQMPTAPLQAAAWSPDGQRLVTISQQGELRLWHGSPRPALGQHLAVPAAVKSPLAWSHDGRRLAATGSGSSAVVWRPAAQASGTAPELTLSEPHATTDRLHALAWSPQGSYLAAACSQRHLLLWDVRQGQLVDDQAATFALKDLAFRPGGDLLAALDDSGGIQLWRLRRGTLRPLGDPLRHPSRAELRALAWSSDGHTLASGGADRLVHLWDVATGKLRGASLAGTATITALAFDPRGRQLAVADLAGRVRLWEPATGSEEELRTGGSAIQSLAWSPEGRLLAGGSRDGSVVLWDTTRRQPLGQPLDGGGSVLRLTFTAGGEQLVASVEGHPPLAWDTSPAAWRARACRIANRDLGAEWQRYLPDHLPYRATCGFATR